MVLSELGADLLFTQIKIEGRKSSFVNLSRAASNLRQSFENRLEEGPSRLCFEIRESPGLRKQPRQATVYRVNIAYYARIVVSHLKISLLAPRHNGRCRGVFILA